MRAAVFHQPGSAITIEEVEIGLPQEDEVLVRLRASGVCHSDYHVVLGEWTRPRPMILGHEGAGVVEAVGAHVRDVSPGDHVILSWKPNCRRCTYCVTGRPHLCTTVPPHASAQGWRDPTPPRVRMAGRPVYSFAGVGSFAEYALVAESAAISIRPDMPLETAALIGCAVMTGVGAVTNTARVEAGASVLVIGCGGVGLAIVQGAALVGAGPIIAVDLIEAKLESAASLGATHLINPRHADIPPEVRRITGAGVEYAFEAIGVPRAIEQAYESLRPGGMAIVVGQAPEGVRISIDPYDLSDQEKTIRGCNYGSGRPSVDFPRLVELYLAGKLPLDRLVSRTTRLEEINEAFGAMGSGSALRTVIRL